MAHLVRQQRVRYVDREGHRVPKGTRGAKKVVEKTGKWYGAGVPGQGKRRVPLAFDKEAAGRMLNDLVKAAERGEAKMLSRDAAAKPLRDHLKDFETELAAGLQVGTSRRRRTAPTEKQVGQVVQRVRDVLVGCDFRMSDDLKCGAGRLARYLNNRVSKPKSEGGVSSQTATFLLAEARRFARWIARRGTGIPPDVFDGIAGFDPQNDRKHARRDVSPDELDRLLTTTAKSARSVRGLTGTDRHHLYLTAFATGFRVKELAALSPAHFHLAEDPPSVTLPGKLSKNRKGVRPPVPPAVAVALRSFLAGKPVAQPVWPGKWHQGAAAVLRVDLAAAGVPYCVETPHGKEFADFHALRHTFVSALAAAGTDMKSLQSLARHSDPRLTLGIYSHARSAELVKAVGRLRVPGGIDVNPLAKLDRDRLEGAVIALAILLNTLLAPTGQSVGTLRGTLKLGIAGDSGGQLDTVRRLESEARN